MYSCWCYFVGVGDGDGVFDARACCVFFVHIVVESSSSLRVGWSGWYGRCWEA